jgi:CRP-like cAMP-binding protein
MNGLDWSRISLFEGFPAEWIEAVKPIFELVEKKAGEALISEGEVGDEMFILVSGRVRVTKSMLLKDMDLPILELENPRKVLATLDEAGYPLFGEIALIDRDTRSATVNVLEDSRFLATSRERFFSLVECRPEIGARLLFVLARRMAATIRRNNAELIKLSTALALALSRVR